jgi:hypothetical protein
MFRHRHGRSRSPGAGCCERRSHDLSQSVSWPCTLEYVANREAGKAKFWLEPVRLEKSRGFGRAEIGRIERLVAENAAFLLRSWHEYFGD